MNRFDIVAKEWDNKPTSQLVAKATLQTIREYLSLEKRKILDYGCGTGLLAFSIANEANSILGMDNSAGMVEVFNKKAQDFGFKNIKAVQHNIDNEDLPSKAFDIIITSMALHHIQNADSFFRKCKEALKPKGYLCVSDLDEEDGTFHKEIQNDVHHFGFSKKIIDSLYTKNEFRLIYLDNVCKLEQENGTFPIFLGIGQL